MPARQSCKVSFMFYRTGRLIEEVESDLILSDCKATCQRPTLRDALRSLRSQSLKGGRGCGLKLFICSMQPKQHTSAPALQGCSALHVMENERTSRSRVKISSKLLVEATDSRNKSTN
eukprot:1139761-Pelagomonas_calceolata.AAC.4